MEVKSFRSYAATEAAKTQAARYGRGIGLTAVSLVMFVPVADDTVLQALSGETIIDGVTVTVTAIEWT